MRVKHIEVEVPARLVLRGTIPTEADAQVVVNKARELVEEGTVPFVTGPANHLGIIGSLSYYAQRGEWKVLRFDEKDAGVATAAEIQRLRNEEDEREPENMDADPLAGYVEEIPDFSEVDMSPDLREALTCVLSREGDEEDGGDGAMRLACLVERLIAEAALTTEQGLIFFRAVFDAEATRRRRDEYRRQLIDSLDDHAEIIADIRAKMLQPSPSTEWLGGVAQINQSFATLYESIVASYAEHLAVASAAISQAVAIGEYIDKAAIESGAWRPGQSGTARQASQNGAGDAERANGDTETPPA